MLFGPLSHPKAPGVGRRGRRAAGRQAPGSLGCVGRRLACRQRRRSEERRRDTGKQGRCSKWRWGRAAGRASEEIVAAMTAASGCAGPAPGTVPAPTFAFPDHPDASEEREPGSLLLVFVLFKKSAQRMLRTRDGRRVREGVGVGGGERRILLARVCLDESDF